MDHCGGRASLPPVTVTQGPFLSVDSCVLVSPAIKSPKMYEKGQVQPIGLQSFVCCYRMSGHYSQVKLHWLHCPHRSQLTSQSILWLKRQIIEELVKVLRSIFLFKVIIRKGLS